MEKTGMPNPVECLGNVQGNDTGFAAVIQSAINFFSNDSEKIGCGAERDDLKPYCLSERSF